MSRSRRKTPVFPMCGTKSEKPYKRQRAQQERARVRQALAHGDFEAAEDELAPWDEWSTGRDGKHYNPDYEEYQMRK